MVSHEKKKKNEDHEVYRDVLVCRLRCGRNMSFTDSTVHIYVITSADTDPRGELGVSSDLSVFPFKVSPYSEQVLRPGTRAYSHFTFTPYLARECKS